VNSKQIYYEVTGRSIVNQAHHSPVIIIITITAYHCSLDDAVAWLTSYGS